MPTRTQLRHWQQPPRSLCRRQQSRPFKHSRKQLCRTTQHPESKPLSALKPWIGSSQIGDSIFSDRVISALLDTLQRAGGWNPLFSKRGKPSVVAGQVRPLFRCSHAGTHVNALSFVFRLLARGWSWACLVGRVRRSSAECDAENRQRRWTEAS